MRVSVRSLRLRPGEEHRETLAQFALDPFVLGGETYAVAAPDPPATLTVQRAATGDLFRLELSTSVDGPCVRCLAPARAFVDVVAQEYEATDPGPDDELRCEYLADGELDVGAWARDQVVFALPDLILCRPDCAGLCPTCGKDLNAEPHEHPGEAIDGRWAALEALRADMPPEG